MHKRCLVGRGCRGGLPRLRGRKSGFANSHNPREESVASVQIVQDKPVRAGRWLGFSVPFRPVILEIEKQYEI